MADGTRSGSDEHREQWRDEISYHALRLNHFQLMNSLVRYANDQLLTSSKQGVFLAAALIAAVPLWSPSHPTSVLTKLGLFSFVGSIIASIGVHFFVGTNLLGQVRKNGNRDEDTERSGLIWPAWVLASIQALTLASGLILAAVVLL